MDDYSTGSTIESDWCPTRDGIRLATDVYRPATTASDLPVLLLRTPYGKTAAQASDVLTYAHPSWYARHGYIVVVQDVRGRYESEGEFDAFRNERNDSQDAIQWCSRLPGSTGDVGMYGMSYGGYVQLAGQGASALKCVAPGCIAPDIGRGLVPDGVPRLALIISWTAGVAMHQARAAGRLEDARTLLGIARSPQHLYSATPLLSHPSIQLIAKYLPFLLDWISTVEEDETYWNSYTCPDPDVPALYIAGWYDTWAAEIIDLHGRQQRTDQTSRLIVGPWAHVPWRSALSASCSQHSDTEIEPSINELHLEWFDWHLKGVEPSSWMKKHDSAWFDYGDLDWRYGSFGSQTTDTALHTWSDGLAAVTDHGQLISDIANARRTTDDTIVDDPLSPAPSIGGWSCCYEAVTPIGPKDQQFMESHSQVAVYTSAELDEGTIIEGNPILHLAAAPDQVPATLFATLCLVRDGSSINVARGLLRLRSVSQSSGHVRLSPVAITTRSGDRIRLQIHASSFPEFAVDGHTDEPLGTTDLLRAPLIRVDITTGEATTLVLPTRHT